MKVEVLNFPVLNIDYSREWSYCSTNPVSTIIEGIEIPDCEIYCGEVYLGYSIKNKVTIRKGYAFDGMTSFPDTTKNIACAMWHDFFYQTALISRLNADKILRMMMEQNGAKGSRAVYLGVRLFGWSHYGKQKKIRIVKL